MPNFMLGDPAAILFFKSVESVRLFEKWKDEYPYLALESKNTLDYEKRLDDFALKLAAEACLYPSTQTLDAMAFHYVSYVAFQQALTWQPTIA